MRIAATAKINLFLKVLDRRSDGYHNIETVYQSIGLADRLEVEPIAEGTALDCELADLPTGHDNVVVRAIELTRRTFPGRVRGVRVGLDKHIPVGGGLGGGSADAAAVLKACNVLFRLGLDADALRALGSQLGMDVPFLIEGGRAIGRDRGDDLEPLKIGNRLWAVVAVPDVVISTRWAYDRMDAASRSEAPTIESFVEQLESQPLEVWGRRCVNDFERVVFPAYPELERLRDRLLQAGCAGAFLSGSGAAVVGLTEDTRQANDLAEEMAQRCRLAVAVPFLDKADPS